MNDNTDLRNYWINGRANLQPIGAPTYIEPEPEVEAAPLPARVALADLPAFMQQNPGARILARDGGWPVVEVKQ